MAGVSASNTRAGRLWTIHAHHGPRLTLPRCQGGPFVIVAPHIGEQDRGGYYGSHTDHHARYLELYRRCCQVLSCILEIYLVSLSASLEVNTDMAEEPKGQEQAAAKTLRHRSPAYPSIPLRKALERVKQFYTPQREHPAPITAALDLWDFKAKSSGGLQTISALKQFGLMGELESASQRQVQLTELALRIIRDERDPSPDREALIKRAALSPKIYAEMWTKWGPGFSADATMRFFLVQERKFNEASIGDLIADYKDTVTFAKLTESDKSLSADGEETPDDGIKPPSDPKPPPLKGTKLMDGERELTTGLLSKTASFRLIVSGAVGEKEIERLIAKLQLDKEILADPEGDREE